MKNINNSVASCLAEWGQKTRFDVIFVPFPHIKSWPSLSKMELVIVTLKWFQAVVTSWVGSPPHAHLEYHDLLEKLSILALFTSQCWRFSAHISHASWWESQDYRKLCNVGSRVSCLPPMLCTWLCFSSSWATRPYYLTLGWCSS